MSTGTFTRTHGGILKEILRTPVFKDILRTNLNQVNPSTGSDLVKTLMGQDPEVFLGLVSTLPAIVNALTRACLELGVQLKDKFPAELLKSYLEALYNDLDTEDLKGCGKVWGELVSSLWEASSELRIGATRSILAAGPRVVADAINGLARSVNAFDRENPGAVGIFIASVLKDLDREEVRQATHSLAGAFLDQKWHLASWAWGLARSRVKKRFGI